MNIIELLLTSISLAMDAFAVSICKGLSMEKYSIKKGIIIGLYFGIFQSLMPMIGYLLGNYFENIINSIDHWIAFILLVIIGLNLIKDGLSKEDEMLNENINIKEMIPLSIATSIDALAVGITFSILEINMIKVIIIIGIITLLLSIIGTKLGYSFGNKYKDKSKILGGVILIIIGIKILLKDLKLL